MDPPLAECVRILTLARLGLKLTFGYKNKEKCTNKKKNILKCHFLFCTFMYNLMNLVNASFHGIVLQYTPYRSFRSNGKSVYSL